MCFYPISVRKRTTYFRFNDHELTSIRKIPYLTGNDYQLNDMLRPYHWTDLVVPCGKCLECLKAKQNDLSVRAAAEANKRGSMHFLTLTYDWKNVPLSYALRMVDKFTGEVFEDAKCKLVSSEFTKLFKRTNRKTGEVTFTPKYPDFYKYHTQVRDALCKLPKGPEGRVLSVPYNEDMQMKLFGKDVRFHFDYSNVDRLDDDLNEVQDLPLFTDDSVYDFSQLEACETERVPDIPFFDDDFYYYIDFSLSLRRRDVLLWLKRSRLRYQRKFGKKLSDFSYVVVGEYGPKTCRPHYHIGLFGLSDSEAKFLAAQWSFGFVDYKRVNPISKDGKGNGYIAASKYIGKYMSKGVFECPLVYNNLVEKPRLVVSVDFGIEGERRVEVVNLPNGRSYKRVRFDVPTNVISFYRGYDVFGEYDVNTFKDSKDLPLSFFDLERLHKLLCERNYYSVVGQRFRISKILLKRIWYEKQGEVKKRLAPVLVRRALQSFIQFDFDSDFIRKFRKCNPKASTEDLSKAFVSFKKNNEVSASLKSKSYYEAAKKFYVKSLF